MTNSRLRTAGLVVSGALCSGLLALSAAPPASGATGPSGTTGTSTTTTAPVATTTTTGTPGSATITAAQAAQLQARSLADARGAGWVVQVEDQPFPAAGIHGRLRCVGVTGKGIGRATCRLGAAQAREVLAANHIFYLAGNRLWLTRVEKVAAPVATKMAGHFIAFRPGARAYNQLADSLETGPALVQVRLTGTLAAEAPAMLGGVRVIPLVGGANPAVGRGQATLYVTDTAHPYPVRWTLGATSVNFSKWGRPAAIYVPGDAYLVPVR